ncbi:unnamed protein product [Paramecium pentaurelia]|uniref:Uncharacterized protein n=1 Tax=Paramecium pentaurelia TaxID=43138 RepID=A0A8S1YLC3_9CILI|nr:unnamed protein product [Paramecium pentaurelia]
MGLCKEDIKNLKDICLPHMMYKYQQYLNMSYKQYHKLSKQFQQSNNDLHKFNIQYQMCKQHSKQDKLNNLSQIYKTLESMLSKKIDYKLGNYLNKQNICITHFDKILGYKSHMLKELYNLHNQRNNPDISHRFKLFLDHNSKLLNQYKIYLHIQFIKIRQTLNMQSDIINNNIIYIKIDDVIRFYIHF